MSKLSTLESILISILLTAISLVQPLAASGQNYGPNMSTGQRYIDIYGLPGQGPIKPEPESAPANTNPPPDQDINIAKPKEEELPPFPGEEKKENKEKTKKKAAPKKPKESKTKEKNPDPTKKKPSVDNLTIYDPIKVAAFDISIKNYNQSLAILNAILADNPNHPEAHYLKAIVNVHLRHYLEATQEYQRVINLVPDTELGQKAIDGLKHLND